jgi:hypothetical protein
MPPEQIVEMVKNGQVDPKWILFQYSKIRSFLMLLYKLFFTGIFLGTAIILYIQSPHPLVSDTKIIVAAMGTIGCIALLVLLRHIYTLFFLSSTMIVLTETGLIKSIRGKIYFWEYNNIQNLRQIISQSKNTMPTYSIEFKDAKSGKILELVRGNEFGSSQNIFQVLQTRISL